MDPARNINAVFERREQNRLEKKNKCIKRKHTIRSFFYNKEKHTFLTKTSKQWLIFILLYILFLIVIVIILFLVIGMATWLFKQQGSKLMIIHYIKSPGATIIPIRESYQYGNLVWYRLNKKGEMKNNVTERYINEISKSLVRAKSNLAKMGPCGVPDYGYGTPRPCLYLKLNKISDWSPGKFNAKSNIPKDTPKEVKESIDIHRTTLWIYCEGKTNFDKDNLISVKYFPENVFEDSIFGDEVEGRNIIAFQVSAKTNYVITITCTLVGRNIDPRRNKFHSMIFIKEI